MTVKDNGLYNWLNDFPWLTSCLGDVNSPVWFVAENPSLNAVKEVDSRYSEKTENLQWDYGADECKLFRDAIAEANLKSGNPALNEGWKCYMTNVIKEPEVVGERNRKKSSDSQYWKSQSEIWMPVLQSQIDFGKPKVLIAVGGQADRILKYMESLGLQVPATEKIQHYSYIMKRPESGTRRGPRHPERIAEFKESIVNIAERYAELS